MTTDNSSTTVLVTGASGFVGMHCTLHLLENGYNVRGTVRSLSREAHLREVLGRHVDIGDRLSFAAADLLKDDGWEAAAEGCDYALHVASPFPPGAPKHPDDLVIPAREGTLRLLRAAAKAGVKRVVLTSSLVTVYEGRSDYSELLDENDWTVTEGKIDAYSLSKTLAERAAWDFAADNGQMELVAVNPGAILGPVLDGNHQMVTSGELITKFMRRELPASANLRFYLVGVRDVAAAHLAAMTTPEAAGKRYCCFAEEVEMQEIARILDRNYADQGYKVPTGRIPDFVVRFLALFDKTTRLIVPGLGRRVRISSDRIRSELDWQPRPPEEFIVDMADSLIEHGLL